MDFKSRPPRRTNIDGFVNRSQPPSGQRPVARYTPHQQPPSPARYASPRPLQPHAVSPAPQPTMQSQKPAAFSNYYSSYSSKPPTSSKPTERHAKKGRNWKKIGIRSGIGVLAIGVIIGGWLGWKVIGNLDKIFHGNPFSDAGALLSNTTLKGESQGRVNILLAGDSTDRIDAAQNGGDLTDSLMVVSINTKTHSAFMLSIPRDLWINVPNEGYGKINSTYEYDGMSGLEALINKDLGIPIDYYALVNYQAFEGIVNAVGGVSINIQSPDPRGLYDPQPFPGATNALKLSNGVHELDGEQALNLARARGDAYGSYGFPQGDFNRTQHQRQLLIAIAQKAQSIGVVSNPLKVSQIFDTLGTNVKTNLTLPDVLALIRVTKGLNPSNIASLAYSYGGTNPLLTNYTSPTGQDGIIPAAGLGDYAQLQAFYRQQTSNNPVAKEAASVVILNGSDVIGLARQEETVLEKQDFTVSDITDATNEYPDSMIVDLSKGKDSATKAALQQIFSSNTTTVTSTSGSAEAGEATNYPTANFVVILGKNWDNANTSNTSSTSNTSDTSNTN
jgi:LCP family protein required for cell wall assembly